jgi:hypothetical protein
MASAEPTKTNSAPSTFATGLKADRVIQTPFADWSWPVARLGAFDPARPYLHPEGVDIALDIDRYDFAVRVTIEDGRPVARMESQFQAEPAALIPATTSGNRIRVAGSGTTTAACSRGRPITLTPT